MLKDEVLHVLEQRKGTVVTGGQLATILGVSRNAIWKSVHVLQDNGSKIVSIPNIGYKLLDDDDSLSAQLITKDLSTIFLGRNLKLLSTVHSTNQYLRETDMASIENGYVVIADEQTLGRGRRNRVFLSTKGGGIYLSFILKLNGVKQDIRLFTICAAVAVSKAIESICKIKADIKWVNDIYCNGKKICGILTEAMMSGELQELDTMIMGIGINTSTVPTEISSFATSIQEETGLCAIRNSLIAEVLNQFEIVYFDYTKRAKKKEIIQYYESRLFIVNQEITVMDAGETYTAIVLGVDDDGALIVRNAVGEVNVITTGEIKLKTDGEKDKDRIAKSSNNDKH